MKGRAVIKRAFGPDCTGMHVDDLTYDGEATASSGDIAAAFILSLLTYEPACSKVFASRMLYLACCARR
jgi:hypothetical protein